MNRSAALRARNSGALIPFPEAGDPGPATAEAVLHGVPAMAAELVEAGVPFADPMADGAIIQATSTCGLAADAMPGHALKMVACFRVADADTPVVLTGIPPGSTATAADGVRDARMTEIMA